MKNIIAILFVLLFSIATFFAFFGGDVSGVFVVITAVVALGVSLFNFYYQHFRSIHDLSCTLVAIGYNGKKFTAHYTFENIGTYQEIVIGGTFVFPMDDDGRQYSTLRRNHANNDHMPELMAPFVINPKEIILKNFEWDITYNDLLIQFQSDHGSDFRQKQPVRLVSLKIDFVNPKTRTKSSKLIKSADINFYDEFIGIRRPYMQQYKLFEGELSGI